MQKEELPLEAIAFLEKAVEQIPPLYQKLIDKLNYNNNQMLFAHPPLTLKPEGVNEKRRYNRAMNHMRSVRSGLTIIMEHEKIQMTETDDIETIILPILIVIIKAMNSGITPWRGETMDSHVNQLNEIIHYIYFFGEETEETKCKILSAIENILCRHRKEIF
ncbi:MAG: hypothetical protein LUI85_22015 [Bacteroides sp.]|nr:hypothetical protein [Bacteroides sp.]